MLHSNASVTLTRLVAILSVCFIGLTQCQDSSTPQPNPIADDDIPATPLVYNNAHNIKAPGQIATWILRTRYETSRDSITNWGATLGRYIFYDKQLSANGATACASCHHQDKAFTDGEAFSTGFQGGQTKFSAMSTVNLGLTEDYAPGYFWDGRADRLREQVMMPFQDPIEMGMTLPGLVGKMNSIPYYPSLFKKAYGSSQITAEKIADGLNQFLLSIVSYRSKFHQSTHLKTPTATDKPGEQYVKGFSELENRGYYSFVVANCVQCHQLNGMLVLQHLGNGVNKDAFKDGKSKVPTLFNSALTAPYMHDGRFKTLEAVIDHYKKGKDVTTIETLDTALIDKVALVAFLRTLTDEELTKDQRFSDPFRQ